MTRVRVRGFTVVRDAMGAAVVEVDVTGAQTITGVLQALLDRYGTRLREVLCDPYSGELTTFPIRLNDEIISSTLDRDRPIESGDEIAIIFPVGGGC